MLAVRSGNEAIVKLLLQSGAEVTDESYEALKKIKDETKKDAVKKILDDVVSLFKAISADEKEEVDKLIQAGVSLNARSKDGWTPLMVAIVDDYENAGSEQKPETDTNLVKARKLEIINLLLEQKNEDGTLKFDINAKTKLYKNTALHFAVRTGDKDIVELLIKNGAEVNSELSTGHTPLMLAVRSGNEEIVNLLLQNGAKINLKNKKDHTPLMLAVRSGNEAIVNLLLQNGAEVTDESYKALKKIKDETKKDAVKKILDDKAVEAKKS
jgi:ankyrin repeat protein